MTTPQWDQQQFDRFTGLRDGLRTAVKAGDHAQVVNLGTQILALHDTAPCLKIATHGVLRGMGIASAELGDDHAAERYLIKARIGLMLTEIRPNDWHGDLVQIEEQLQRLRERRDSHRTPGRPAPRANH